MINSGIRLVFLALCISTGCQSRIANDGNAITSIDLEVLRKAIELDPSKLYVISARAKQVVLDRGLIEERTVYLITIDSIDGVQRTPPLKYHSFSLPRGVVEGEQTELFAYVSLAAGGKIRPSEFASKIPIPPLQKDLTPQPDYSVGVYMVLCGVVDRDPFKGGRPPVGENWILPEEYIRKLVAEEVAKQRSD